MPSNIIIPVLMYRDVDTAIDWLCKTLGFRLRWRAGNHRAQLSYNGSSVVVTQLHEPSGNITKDTLMHHSVMVRVEDVDAHYRHALSSGATIPDSPRDYPYGERQYSLQDTGGHHWTFSQSIADILPEEWGGKTYEL